MRHLVIGGGSIGRRHLRNLKQLGQNDLYCLRREQDDAFAYEFSTKVITHPEEVMSNPPDVVYVCNPTALHQDALKLAVQCNAHVFMEKPLTHSESSLQEIIRIWSETRVFFIGFMLRFHPLVKQIRQLLDDQAIGKVYSARFEFGSYLPYWHPEEDYHISYAARKELGGGVINTITHELDLVQYFFGHPETVTALSKNYGKLSIDVEELAEALFEYPDHLVSLHLDYLQKDYDRQIRILGDDGKLSWDWHANQVIIHRHGNPPKTISMDKAFDVNDLYLDELQYFLKLFDAPQTINPLDFKHAVRNTKIMLAMHHSAVTGKKMRMG